MSKFSLTIMELMEDPNYDLKFDYEIWDETYRETLDAMIKRKFMFREICYKNPYRWLFEFNELLARLMKDKYNKLFLINSKQDFNPLYNVDMTETFEEKRKQKGKENSKNIANNKSEINNESNVNNETNYETETNTKSIDKSLNVMLQYPQDSMLSSDLPSNIYANSGQRAEGNGDVEDKGKDKTIGTGKNVLKGETKDTIDSSIENRNENDYESLTTHKTLGSSAGLPFSRAMQQYKDYIEDFQLHTELFNELEPKFYQLYTGEE